MIEERGVLLKNHKLKELKPKIKESCRARLNI